MKPGTDRWRNIIQLFRLERVTLRRKLQDFQLAEYTKAPGCWWGCQHFLEIISRAITQIFHCMNWNSAHWLRGQLWQYFLIHTTIPEFLRGKESLSMPNTASTVAVGWNSSLLPWRPREVFLWIWFDNIHDESNGWNCRFGRNISR